MGNLPEVLTIRIDAEALQVITAAIQDLREDVAAIKRSLSTWDGGALTTSPDAADSVCALQASVEAAQQAIAHLAPREPGSPL